MLKFFDFRSYVEQSASRLSFADRDVGIPLHFASELRDGEQKISI